MKDRYGIYLLALLAIGLIFHFYMGLGGESETTGQRQAREAYEREQTAELEERLQEAYERGYNDAEDEYVFQIEELQSALGEAEEMAMHLSIMLDAPDDFTWDDVYDAVEELYTHLQNSR